VNIQQVQDEPRASLLQAVKEQWRGALFFVLILAALGVLLNMTLRWMWDEHRLPLSKMVVQGNLTYVKNTDVQVALSNLDTMGTFMSQNIDVLQQQLLTIPWVEQASVRKQWPDTLKVFLTEHQVAAIWNGNELLDIHGTVFNGDIGELKQDVVKLYGPDDSGKLLLDTWREYEPQFEVLKLQISSLVMNDRRAWQIILKNGIRLELGKESLDERIHRFIALYRYFGDKVDKISYVDLRYDTGAAVGWFPEQEVGQENSNE
jgi:cell division protein FtsQ